MRTVSVRELKSNPSEALRAARLGPVLVVTRGLPEALLVSVAEDASASDLTGRVGEAAAAIRGLAEQRGARAVRAVDRASRGRGRAVAEARASYGPEPDAPGPEIALARLVATVSALTSPRRISRIPSVGDPPVLRLIVDVDRPPAAGLAGRVAAAATAGGSEVALRWDRTAGAPADIGEEVIFDRADVPLSMLDQMIRDGTARPPTLPGPIVMPVRRTPAGRSASDEIIREREESPW